MSDSKLNTLGGYKNELVDAFQECAFSLREIAEKLSDSQIFDEYIKNIFFSLDYDHLDLSLCTRYLVQEIVCSLKRNADREEIKSEVWDRFLEVLVDLGGKARTLSSKLNGVEALPLDISKENKINGPLLKENDISLLMEVMSKYAYMWEELCVALSFPQNAIEECRQGSSFVIKIYRVLHSWIVDKISQEPPTLLSLQSFLQGPLLNCANASTELHNKFYDKKNKRKELLESLGSSIGGFLHPSDTDVKFGSSALLEVQVDSSQPVSYEWLKDGVELYSDPNCRGADHSILCVKKVTKSEKYSCSVCIGNKTFTTNKAVLSDIVPHKDQYLVDKYCKYKEVPEDSWPPVSTGAFIKLAIIVGQKKSWMDTIEHDMDEILGTKDLIDYTEIFGTCDSGLTLVEGRPGSGKTTLVFKIARDWANSHWVLRGASKVYLIPLRMLNTTNHKNLFDILRPFYVDDEDTREAIKDLKRYNGKGVCFILDGLDEYKRNNQQGIIHDLIEQNILPHAMVIVASRPVGTVNYREKHGVNKRVEVLGFTKENVYKYINNYPFPTSEKALNLIEYLDIHINILHMCYLPVHASMTCYLYMKLGDEIPTTETKLYEYFTMLTIVRKMKRDDNSQSKFQSLNSLTGDTKEHFIKICNMAFNMIKRSVQMIPKCELDAQLDHTPGSDDPFLGLVVVDAIAELLWDTEMYTFLHLTSQEFHAAWHLSKLDESKLYNEIKFLCLKKQYNVLKFYFGLVNIEQSRYQLREVLKSHPGILHCLQCAFESHTKLACDIVNERIFFHKQMDTLVLEDYSIMPLDFTAIGYAVYNCTSHLSKLYISNCYFNLEGIRAFISAVKKTNLHFITHLDISLWNPFPDQAINLLLNSLHYLKYLDLGGTLLNDEKIRSVTRNVTLSQLRVLCVNVHISKSGVAELLKFDSQNFCQLKASSRIDLNFLEDNKVRNFTWNYLCHAFKKQVDPLYSRELILCCLNFRQIRFENFRRCTSFCLVDCCIDDGATAIIVTCLTRRQSVTHLQTLILDLNNIALMGALFLAYLLKKSPDILNFSVLGNNIDSVGAEAIAMSLENCKFLVRCDVQLNNIEDYGAIAIAKATAHLPHLKLYLWNHNLTQYGIAEVLNCKKDNSINSNTIQFSHAQYLQIYPQLFDKLLKVCHCVSEFKVADTLKTSTNKLITNSEDLIPKVIAELMFFNNLVHLNMEECRIGSSQAMNLVEALKYMPQLRILNLCLNNLCSPGTIAIAGGLKFCPQLEVLDMSTNAFSSPDSISALAEGLKHVPGLKELVLSDNRLFSMAGDILPTEFQKLCKLHLVCCAVDSHGATSLAKHINNCPSLRNLDLSENDLGDGLVDIANAVKCRNLQILSLNFVRITHDAARALSSTLKQCVNLEELYFRACRMDAANTEGVADGLKGCKKLRILHCTYNKVSSRAAARLSRCFQHGSIEQLVLLGCGIDDRGCITLAVGLHYCSNLELLRLENNKIGSESAKALANELKSLTSMKNLYIYDNPINEDSAIHLVKELRATYVNLTDTEFSEEIRKKIQEINLKKMKVPSIF